MRFARRRPLIFPAIRAALCMTHKGRYFRENYFAKHFQKSRNVRPVHECITGEFDGSTGDHLGMSVLTYWRSEGCNKVFDG